MKNFLKNLPLNILLIILILAFGWKMTGYGVTVYRRDNPRYVTLTTNIPYFSKTFTFGNFPEADPIANLKHKEMDMYWTLTNNEKIVYDTILQRANDIWNGKTNSLEIYVPLDNFEYETQHKVSTRPIVMQNELSNLNFQKIGKALHQDYEWLLWFEGQMEWYWEEPNLKYSVDGNEGSSFRMFLTPSEKYDGEHLTLNKESTDAVLRARHEVEAIISESKEMSTDQKIEFFKNKVLELTNYDKDAVGKSPNDTDAYVEANSIIDIFDSQGTHMAMCGGYSNAFQALCDLAGIDEVYTRVGNFETSDSKAYHAWNLVVKDGQKYLYDITNSEDESIGRRNKLVNKPVEGNDYNIDLGYDLIQYSEKVH